MAKVPEARRRLLVLSLVGFLVAALGGLITSTATAASPTVPVKIVIDKVSSTVTAPIGTPDGAVPYVLVAAGQSFSVDVSFYDASGAPASFTSDTTLSITSNRGALSPSTAVAPRGATAARLTTSLPTAANQVSLMVQVAGGKLARTVTPGTSQPDQLFDVMSQLRLENSSLDFQEGIGGRADCSEATREHPVCGIVVLPSGAASEKVLLSLGVCDSAYAGCGSTKGSLVQTLADLKGLYTKTEPATMVMKCDKSLCGGGSIQSQTLSYSLKGNDPLARATACPAKGTVGDEPACVDYVQSKRDGSGDTHLYLLFTEDARVSVG